MIGFAVAAAAKSPSAWDQPGTLGFLVVFGLAVILYFVFRSLSKHLRKINEAARLEAEAAERAGSGADAPDRPGQPGAAADALANGSGPGSGRRTQGTGR